MTALHGDQAGCQSGVVWVRSPLTGWWGLSSFGTAFNPVSWLIAALPIPWGCLLDSAPRRMLQAPARGFQFGVVPPPAFAASSILMFAAMACTASSTISRSRCG